MTLDDLERPKRHSCRNKEYRAHKLIKRHNHRLRNALNYADLLVNIIFIKNGQHILSKSMIM